MSPRGEIACPHEFKASGQDRFVKPLRIPKIRDEIFEDAAAL